MSTQAKDYLDLKGRTVRVCVPAYERMKQLYAYGHTNAQIVEILSQEFKDIDYNPINAYGVKMLIADNSREFENARMELGLKCREEIQHQVALLYRATEDVECVMVKVFVDKMFVALDELADLDMAEKNDDGNFVNTSRMFVLIELATRMQKTVAKIVGTDALREIEIFRKKAQAKMDAESQGGSLIPTQARGRTLDDSAITNFI